MTLALDVDVIEDLERLAAALDAQFVQIVLDVDAP
jgi:hypothetical protein